MRARRRLMYVSALGALAATFVAGTAAATFFPEVQAAILAAKRETRAALGLPKQWVHPDHVVPDSTRAEVACPAPEESTFIVTGGQSNAANTNSSLYPGPSTPRVVEFYGGHCYVHADPVLGATSRDGSLWVEFGNRLAKEIDGPIVFVHTAIGGTQFSDWNDNRSAYFERLNERLSEAAKAGYVAPTILWHQGETDAALTTDFQQFERDVETLLGHMLHIAPSAQVYLFQASRCIGGDRSNGVPAIVASLHAVASRMDRVTPGLNTDAFGADYRRDGCHFNSLGRQAIVAAAAPQVAAMIESQNRS